MRHLRALVFVALSLLVASPAFAQVGYGNAVAVGDGDVFVGEPGNTVPSGIVYVYRQQDGAWVEVAELTAPDAGEADGFGGALLVDGDRLLVGAPGIDREAVFVFRAGSGTWIADTALTGDDAELGDGFGTTLAAEGDLIAIGAPVQADGEGAVYVFESHDGVWMQIAKLTGERPAPEAEGDEEGEEAPEAPDKAEQAAEGDGEVEEEQEAADEDVADEGQAEDEEAEEPQRTAERFGAAVTIADGKVLVGAPAADRRAGALYVFERTEEGFIEVERQAGDEGDSFGAALLVDGDRVYVGAPGANSGFGAVRIFSVDAEGEWSAAGNLAAFDGSARAGFGATLAADESLLYVGAPGADGFSGRIYRFARDEEGDFTSSTKLGVTADGRGRLGQALALRGDTMVAGIPGADYGAGEAVVMTATEEGWSTSRIESDVRGLEPMTGATIPCENGKIGRFPCDGVELLSFLPLHMMGAGRGVRTNDVWGWIDPETGKEYALVGLTDQAAFVDVTDPHHPVYVGSLYKPEESPGSVWRDIKVYSDHAFIVSDAAGEHGVQIFDLTRLREFDGDPILFEPDAHYERIHSAHNIVINEESAFAYVVGASGGGETCGGGLHMINIEDPKRPMFAGCFADTRTGRRGTGYSHDAQCIMYDGPDEEYRGREVCFGSNETALSVADVTDKRDPVAIGMATYPNVAYTHQTWVSEDHAYLYMNDEGDEVSGTVEGTRTLIWDIRELDDPILVGEYIHDVESVDHNLYVVGDTLYESNYDSGLRILDISDRENPELVGFFDSVPWGEDGQGMGGGSWSNYPFFPGGHVVFTSGREGIFIVRRADQMGNDPND